jgi:hypothetical protein
MPSALDVHCPKQSLCVAAHFDLSFSFRVPQVPHRDIPAPGTLTTRWELSGVLAYNQFL